MTGMTDLEMLRKTMDIIEKACVDNNWHLLGKLHSELLVYFNARRAQEMALNRMSRNAQELGLYDEFTKDVPPV